MFWSGALINRQLALHPEIVSEFDPTRIDSAAYTLRMGSEVFISPTTSGTGGSVTHLAPGQTFSVPPGQFAFLLSEERIELPADVLGFINMKSGVKLRGLVNVSGFHVDPGYRGKLVFSVFNAGPQQVTIRRGDDCFLLWFSSLTNSRPDAEQIEFREYARNKAGFDHIKSEIVSNLGNNHVSLYNLNEKLEELSRRADWWLGLLSFSASLAGAVAVAWLVYVLGLS